MYNKKLNQLVNKYNNTFNSKIKIKPFDVKSSSYIDFGIVNNEKDPLTSKYKNVFVKGYLPNRLE